MRAVDLRPGRHGTPVGRYGLVPGSAEYAEQMNLAARHCRYARWVDDQEPTKILEALDDLDEDKGLYATELPRHKAPNPDWEFVQWEVAITLWRYAVYYPRAAALVMSTDDLRQRVA